MAREWPLCSATGARRLGQEALPRLWSWAVQLAFLSAVALLSGLLMICAHFAQGYWYDPCQTYDCMTDVGIVFVSTGHGLKVAAVSLLPAVILLLWFRRRLHAGADARPLRLLERHALAEAITPVSDGSLVRLRGRVLPNTGFGSAGGRRSVVLSCCLGAWGKGGVSHTVAPRRELHGVDFTLALASGETVSVRVADARIADATVARGALLFNQRPIAIRASESPSDPGAVVFLEDVIVPGEEIEVLGVLRREVDPHAEGALRGARLVPTLVAPVGGQLIVARVR